MDITRAEMIEQANSIIGTIPGVKVYFKFTCAGCGERCTLLEPNVLYEEGECFACGHMTKISSGGFALLFRRTDE